MKSIIVEYSNFDVKCNVVVLEFYDTTLWKKLSNDKKQKIINMLPSKKIGRISDIIRTLNFIERNKSLNASSIYLDFGFGVIRV